MTVVVVLAAAVGLVLAVAAVARLAGDSTRDLLWLAVTFSASTTAAITDRLPLPVRVGGVAVMSLVLVVCLWAATGAFGPHVVYLLRSRRHGMVVYVGVTSPRRDADTSLGQRVAEHLTDTAEHAGWKRDVDPDAATIARRCFTRGGALRSEAMRIAALNRAADKRFCPPLHNVQHGKSRAPWLLVAAYAVESRIVPGAIWHRPLQVDDAAFDELDPVEVPTEPEPVADDDVLAEAAASVRRRAAAAHPSQPVDDTEAVDAAFRAIVGAEGWPEQWGDGDVPSPDGPVPASPSQEEAPKGPGDGTWDAWDTGRGTWDAPEQPHAEAQASQHHDETPENGATRPSGGDTDADVSDGQSDGLTGRSSVPRQCKEAGCKEPAERGPRCGTHHRAWEAERKRQRRRKDGGDE